jgi:competence protein ComFC
MFGLLDLMVPKWSQNNDTFSNYLSSPLISFAQLNDLRLTNDVHLSLDKTTYIYPYQDDIKELISRAKFDGEWAIMIDFANMIAKLLVDMVDTKTVISFVPADPKRYNLRGYHTPEILASNIARQLDLDCIDLLAKPISTTAQVKLKRKERLTNLDKAFEIKEDLPNSLTRYDKIILVDDIVTTATTLKTAAEILQKQFPFLLIQGLVIAH